MRAFLVIAVMGTSLLQALPVLAQDEESMAPSWTISTTVRTGDQEGVTCTLVFPAVAETPRLRLSAKGGASEIAALTFEIRAANEWFSNAEQGAVASLKIGNTLELTGIDVALRAQNDGTLRFQVSEERPLVDAIARAREMTVSIGESDFTYSLQGSFRAVEEFRRCMA